MNYYIAESLAMISYLSKEKRQFNELDIFLDKNISELFSLQRNNSEEEKLKRLIIRTSKLSIYLNSTERFILQVKGGGGVTLRSSCPNYPWLEKIKDAV